MRRTVYLPDDLAKQVDEYLQIHRGLTFSGLVGEELRKTVAPRDMRAFLERAGIVPEATRPPGVPPEDRAGLGEP